MGATAWAPHRVCNGYVAGGVHFGFHTALNGDQESGFCMGAYCSLLFANFTTTVHYRVGPSRAERRTPSHVMPN